MVDQNYGEVAYIFVTVSFKFTKSKDLARHPWLGAGDFVFHKPAGATEIPFLSVLKSTRR